MYNSKFQLMDLEELALRIPDQREREYFKEAVQCYFVGSFRAAIVMAWIVSMDNLFRKLAVLSGEDGRATPLFGIIDKKRKDGDSYENDLINAYKSLEIIDDKEQRQLDNLREIRNWCAHPTGYESSPEEVRHCFRVLVELILSHEAYRGFAYVRNISNEITNSIYFPTSDYKPIVRSYLNKVVDKAYPTLAKELIATAKNASSTEITLNNVERFLCGMVSVINDSSTLQAIAKELTSIATVRPKMLAMILLEQPTLYEYWDDRERLQLLPSAIQHGKDQNEKLTYLIQINFDKGISKETIWEIVGTYKSKISSVFKHFPQLCMECYLSLIQDLKPDRHNNVNFYSSNSATKFIQQVTLSFFDDLTESNKSELAQKLVFAAINGAYEPSDWFLNCDDIPENWLLILNNEIPPLLSSRGYPEEKLVNFTSLVKRWLKLQNPMPESWMKLFRDEYPENSSRWNISLSWYNGSVDTLLEELNVLQALLTHHYAAQQLMQEYISHIEAGLTQR